MHKKVAFRIAFLTTCLVAASPASAQNDTNPVWRGEKIKNYLPHMSWPEVEDLLTRTDMVIIPVGALEQHGHHLPIGTAGESQAHRPADGRSGGADPDARQLTVSPWFPRHH